MAILRGEASFITDDGAGYHLVLDLYAFAEAEEVTGLDPNALLKAIMPVLDREGNVVKKPPLKALGGLLYGGLKTKHPKITLADATNLLEAGECVGEALAKALDGIQVKVKPSAEGKVAAPSPNGTGTKPKRTGRRKD